MNTTDTILFPSTSSPLPRPLENETAASQYDYTLSELERLKAEVEKNSELIRSIAETADSSDRPDPSEDSEIWNLNSISVLMWKSMFWPTGKQWNHDKGQFERHKSFSKIQIRSRSQHWLESNACPLLFTLIPMALAFVEICILSGIMDQGSNVKTHIYGDGFYQSPTWRYSSAGYLRVNFVPLLDSNGVQIGMTSSIDVFNHSLLRDRPSSEAERCLDSNYLMPFSKYQARPQLTSVTACCLAIYAIQLTAQALI